MNGINIQRRNFLKATTATLALAVLNASGMNVFYSQRTYRVGLIGTGWYGKSDLFRLIQVAPVEVDSIVRCR